MAYVLLFPSSITLEKTISIDENRQTFRKDPVLIIKELHHEYNYHRHLKSNVIFVRTMFNLKYKIKFDTTYAYLKNPLVKIVSFLLYIVTHFALYINI